MADVIISPNMSLPIPVVEIDPGPDWANNIDSCLNILDGHNHTPGSGVQITPLGLNINTDLNIQGNDLINVAGIDFSNPAASSVITRLYTNYNTGGGIIDLFFNDGAGNVIALTKAGIVNAVASSIPGESYSGGTFTWVQGSGSTTPANFDIGNIILRPNIPATTYGVQLVPPAAIASQYTLVLPSIPGSTSFLQLDSSGNIIAAPPLSGGITGSNIANNTITGSNLVNQTITATQIANNTITNTQVQTGFALIPVAKYKSYYVMSVPNFWQITATNIAPINYTPVGTIPSPVVIRNTGFTTPTLPAGSLPGITFVAPNTGTIRAQYTFYSVTDNNSQQQNFLLYESSTATEMDHGTQFISNTNFGHQVIVSGLIDVVASTTYTVILKGTTNGGTMWIGNQAASYTGTSMLTMELIYC